MVTLLFHTKKRHIILPRSYWEFLLLVLEKLKNMNKIQILGIASGGLLLIFVLELVRRKKLLEGYSLIWISACIGLIMISLWKDLWEKIAKVLGIYYSPMILFLFAFGFLLLIVLDLTVKVSKLTKENRKLAQTVGLNRIKKRNKN